MNNYFLFYYIPNSCLLIYVDPLMMMLSTTLLTFKDMFYIYIFMFSCSNGGYDGYKSIPNGDDNNAELAMVMI